MHHGDILISSYDPLNFPPGWHIGGHPASLRNERLEGDRSHQQGQGGAHLPGGRLRSRRRSFQGSARAIFQNLIALNVFYIFKTYFSFLEIYYDRN